MLKYKYFLFFGIHVVIFRLTLRAGTAGKEHYSGAGIGEGALQ